MKQSNRKKIILKRALALLSISLLTFSAVLLIKYKLELDQQYRNSKLASNRVQKVINNKTDFRKIKPNIGDPIGEVKLANFTKYMPIIEGEDLTMSMGRGVGRVPVGVLPGSKIKQQVILSGHRETFFLHLKDLKKGQIITVKMPYHIYRYKVDHMKVVKANEASKVYKNGILEREELVLITCYPFNPFSNPNRRYIVTAYPVESNKKKNY